MSKEKHPTPHDNTVHFIFQSKGGCGKSFIASLLAQHFMSIGADAKGFDTDQENRTFYAYKGIPVRHVDVMDDSTTINQKKFDGFMEALLTESGTFVVDNGANSFTPLLGYLVENQGIQFLEENGKRVYLHGVIGGGDIYDDTLIGFNDLAINTHSPLVLWLNEHFGALTDQNGTPFVETESFRKYADKLCGAVVLHKRNPQTYGADIARVTKERLTLAEALKSSAYTIMEKQRLRTFSKAVFDQLAEVRF